MGISLDSSLSLRLSAQVLEKLAEGHSAEATCRYFVQIVESNTPLDLLIALTPSSKVITSRLGSVQDELAQTLLNTDETTITSTQLTTWWPNYAASTAIPIRFQSTYIGQLVILAPDESSRKLLTDVITPLQLGLRVVAAEEALIQRSHKLLTNQNEFVRIVTHDLRSPLTAVKGFASMIEEGAAGQLNSKQQHYISKVVIGTSQIAALIENIADAGRYDPETGFYEMVLVPVDPNEVIRKITSSYLIPTEKSELKIEVNISDDVPIIYADQNMLERAATNLLDNAVKYTPNGGRVTIRVFTSHDRLYFQVEDTGSGIKPEDLRKLFQRHVRLRNPEHRQVRSAGLGLFIVRTVAMRHGGDAFVHSELGKGSTFGIWIPLNEQTLVPI
ncbi:HAMP domain-containing sensor histidine kinase [Aggregatilineales bacterium SYSU G02658]